jgi:hypothetical protein
MVLSFGVSWGDCLPIRAPRRQPQTCIIIEQVSGISAMDGTQTITIEVDSEVADFYNSLTTEDRQKLSAILNLKLREAALLKRSTIDIMDEMSQQAESNDLTPEILAVLLVENDNVIPSETPAQSPSNPLPSKSPTQTSP